MEACSPLECLLLRQLWQLPALPQDVPSSAWTWELCLVERPCSPLHADLQLSGYLQESVLSPMPGRAE